MHVFVSVCVSVYTRERNGGEPEEDASVEEHDGSDVCVCVCACVFVREAQRLLEKDDATASLVKALCIPTIFPDLDVKYLALISLAASVLHLLNRSIGLG